MRLGDTWGSVRGVIRESFSFAQIKDLCGAAGLPVHRLAHLQQRAGGGASKGQLMDAIDGLFNELTLDDQGRFVTATITQVLRDRPASRETLEEVLSRVGWGISGEEVHPLALQIDLEAAELPAAVRVGLANCLRRYRDGDTSGAITAICGVVDTLTEEAYARHNLGDHHSDSYQQRASRSFNALETAFKQPLENAGMNPVGVNRLWQNHRGAVNQAAYVLGSFRREFSDAHGVQNAPRKLVQKALDCAVFIVRSIKE